MTTRKLFWFSRYDYEKIGIILESTYCTVQYRVSHDLVFRPKFTTSYLLVKTTFASNWWLIIAYKVSATSAEHICFRRKYFFLGPFGSPTWLRRALRPKLYICTAEPCGLAKSLRKKYFRWKQMCSEDVALTLYAIISHQLLAKVILTRRYEVVKLGRKTKSWDTL